MSDAMSSNHAAATHQFAQPDLGHTGGKSSPGNGMVLLKYQVSQGFFTIEEKAKTALAIFR